LTREEILGSQLHNFGKNLSKKLNEEKFSFFFAIFYSISAPEAILSYQILFSDLFHPDNIKNKHKDS